MIGKMILLPPKERQRALKRLDLLGHRFKWNASILKIAEAVAKVIGVSCPKTVEEQQGMIRRFVANPPGSVMVPMKPLVVDRAMLAALDRAANPYRRFIGDGRG